MNLAGHTLYYKDSCPYCQKVLRFMDLRGITMEKKDTMVANNAEELIRIGGKRQVPCLVIEGEALYESDDIIDYLKQHAI